MDSTEDDLLWDDDGDATGDIDGQDISVVENYTIHPYDGEFHKAEIDFLLDYTSDHEELSDDTDFDS